MGLGAFNLVDVAVGVYLLWGLIRGLKRGLSRELARLLTMFVAVGAGWKLYRPVAERVGEVTRLTEQGSALMGFALTLLAAGGAMVALRWVMRNLTEFRFKGRLERVGGAAAGLLRCALVAGAVITLCSLCPIGMIREAFGERSVLGSALTTHLLPAYAALAEDHPELDLPVPGGAPAGVPRDGAETEGPGTNDITDSTGVYDGGDDQ